MSVSSVDQVDQGDLPAAPLQQGRQMRLPKIAPAVFYGKIEEWPGWIRYFQKCFHEDEHLCGYEKFVYLLNSLGPEPKKVIGGLAPSDEAYQVAIDLLHKRYGDESRIKTILWARLHNFPGSRSDKTRDLRESLDSLEKLLRQLESSGVDLEQYDGLATILLSKFPEHVIRAVQARNTEGSNWTFPLLREKLDEHLNQQEQTDMIMDLQKQRSDFTNVGQGQRMKSKQFLPAGAKSQSFGSRTSDLVGNSTAFDSSRSSSGGSTPKRGGQQWAKPNDGRENKGLTRLCVLCGSEGQHTAPRCPVYATRQSRLDRFKALNRCLACTKEGHYAKDCQSRYKNCLKCGAGHHVSLCPTLAIWSGESSGPAGRGVASASVKEEHSVAKPGKPMAPLTVAKIKVTGPKASLWINAFIDEGSNQSWMDKALAETLGLQVLGTGKVQVRRFHETESDSFDSDRVAFSIITKDLDEIEVECGTVDKAFSGRLVVPKPPEEVIKALQDYPSEYFACDRPDKDKAYNISLIIGSDYSGYLTLPKACTVLPRNYFLVPSKVGLLFKGSPTAEEELQDARLAEKASRISMVMVTQDNVRVDEKTNFELDVNLDAMFRADGIGISEKDMEDEDEASAIAIVEGSTKMVDGRVETGMPWKPNLPPEALPENYGLAIGRFRSQERRYKQDPKILETVNECVKDQIERDVIEKVDDPRKVDGPRLSYVPHQTVTREGHESTEHRQVFDCSARASKGSRSINDCLLKGSSLLPSLVSILLRVMLYPICISCDIQKAFHTIALRVSERDAFRWFWYDDVMNPKVGGKLAVYRFKRVLFGAISSPFVLALVLTNHLQALGTPLALEMAQSAYVDNFFLNAFNVEEAKAIYFQSKEALSGVGMNLRKFISNSSEFNDFVPDNDRAKGPITGLLGLVWDTTSDSISIPKASSNTTGKDVTKRIVLKNLASIFDPMGWATPLLFQAKVYLQRLWTANYEWDAVLPVELGDEWRMIWAEISQAHLVTQPRFFGDTTEEGVTWHLLTYCDASSLGYGAVTFLKRILTDGSGKLRICMAKSRIKPRKEERMPRLELLGASAGSMLSLTVQKALEPFISISKVYLFSDSQCVLHWLRSKSVLPSFVDNRVRAIKERGGEWLYCRSVDNVADMASKPSRFQAWLSSSLWWEGPAWASLPRDQWPDFVNAVPPTSDEEEGEMVTAVAIVNYEPPLKNLFGLDITRYSSLRRLQRVLVFTFRLLKILVGSKLSSFAKKLPYLCETMKLVATGGSIKTEEVAATFGYFLRVVQRQEYPELTSGIHSDQLSKDMKSFRAALNIRLDPFGYLRCYGRLANAALELAVKFPLLLPNGKHHLSKLMVLDAHIRAKHQGEALTLRYLRKAGFWLCRGRQIIRRLTTGKKNMCFICRRWKGPPFEYPPPNDLPIFRVQGGRAFESVGIDGLGTFHYRDHLNEKIKAYLYIFVCTVTRAVHIEIAPTLEAASFVDAFLRFVSRRGAPRLVVCDQARGLVLGSQVISAMFQRAITSPEMTNYCSTNGIKFIFGVPFAPWKNGFFERLVGMFKKTWTITLGRRIYGLWEAQTLVACVEAVNNSRPLTYETETDVEVSALCPENFLLPGATGVPDLSSPDIVECNEEPTTNSTAKQLLGIYKRRLALLDIYWDAFVAEYLPYLREKQRSESKNPRSTFKEVPKIGQVVIIEEPHAERGQWKLGKISRLDVSEDGKVRSVWLRTKTRDMIQRPINKIYPLEADIQNDDEEQVTMGKANLMAMASVCLGARTKVWSSLFIITLLSIISATNGMDFSKGSPCFTFTENQTELVSMEESNECVRKGIHVYKHIASGKLCYRVRNCVKGFLNGRGNCRQSGCSCPAWAQHCSHYKGRKIAMPDNVDEIIESRSYSVCSFEASPQCSSKKSNAKFNQIQLVNGSIYLIRQMVVSLEEKIGEYHCIGSGPVTGTKLYCRDNNCTTDGGTKFCYYKENSLSFLVDAAGRVPVSAWGVVEKSFYGPKTGLASAPQCTECTLECIQGGVNVQLNEGFGNLEVCSMPYCFQISFPRSNERVLLPGDVTTAEYKVRVRVWSHGSIVANFEERCQANPFCESVDCIFCMQRLRNVKCLPYSNELSLFVVVIIGATMVWMTCKICSICTGPCSIGCFCCWTLLRRCKGCCSSKVNDSVIQPVTRGSRKAQRRKKEKQKELEMAKIEKMEMERLYDDRPPKGHLSQTFRKGDSKISSKGNAMPFWKPSGSKSFVVLLGLLNLTNGCAESQTMQAKRSDCLTKGESTVCSFTQITRIALSPQGQRSCLLMRGVEAEPLATLSVEVENIRFVCAKRSEYWTRSFQMRTTATKRCANAGSCEDNKCDDITTESKVAELDGPANDAPGFTYCVESCGCWACSCFYCTYACLYYRNYATSTSSTAFEVFSCPTWTYEVETKIKILNGNQTKERKFILSPGKTEHWEKLDLGLISQSPPAMPILGTKFVTDGSRSIFVGTSEAGQPITGTLGQLQCASKEKAERLECTLAKDSCTCQGHDKTVTCQCAEQELEKLFQDEQKVLPITTNGVTLEMVGEQVTAAVADHVAMELQLSVEGFQLMSTVDKVLCNVAVSKVEGCYSCLTGAKIHTTCKTNKGDAIAHINCQGKRLSTKCDAKGFSRISTVHFDAAEINRECLVHCPLRVTRFKLTGSLRYQENRQVGALASSVAGKEFPMEVEGQGFLEWFGNLFNGKWWLTLLSIIIACVLVIILCPFLCSCLCSTVQSVRTFDSKRRRPDSSSEEEHSSDESATSNFISRKKKGLRGKND